MIKVLIHFLKAVKAVFGSENFTKAINEIVVHKQQRKNDRHDERKEVREADAAADLLKKKRKLIKQERKLKRKEK